MMVADEQMDLLQIPVSDVEKWVAEWTISPEQKSSVLKGIVDAYAIAGLL
jgi:translation initiation factor 3 subunit M